MFEQAGKNGLSAESRQHRPRGIFIELGYRVEENEGIMADNLTGRCPGHARDETAGGILRYYLVWVVIGRNRIPFSVNLTKKLGDSAGIFAPEEIYLDFLPLGL